GCAPRPCCAAEAVPAQVLLRRAGFATLRSDLFIARVLPDASRERDSDALRRRNRRLSRRTDNAGGNGKRQRVENAPRHRGAAAAATTVAVYAGRHFGVRSREQFAHSASVVSAAHDRGIRGRLLRRTRRTRQTAAAADTRVVSGFEYQQLRPGR